MNWIREIKNAPKIKIHSQAGEEGYLDFIFSSLGIIPQLIVDLGAGDGQYLSNTKYFEIEDSAQVWKFDADPRGAQDVIMAWITRENICATLNNQNIPKEFDLLSIDLDGNDYDILYALLMQYRPKVIVCEINGTIPAGQARKIRYNPDHNWNNDDYYGFSLGAALILAEQQGYRVVFQNDSLNAYMVRKDLLADPDVSIDLRFRHSQYHKHNPNGVWENL